MLDETFVFLSQPHIGLAYRKTDESLRQYCKNSEILEFINNSIENSTLNKGVKYYGKNAIKYIYKFNKGSNKRSVSVIINAEDYALYAAEIENLNEKLKQNGFVKKCNLKKIRIFLDTPLVLLTYKNPISFNGKDIAWCLLIIFIHIINWW